MAMGTGLEMELSGLGYPGEEVMAKPRVRRRRLASADMSLL